MPTQSLVGSGRDSSGASGCARQVSADDGQSGHETEQEGECGGGGGGKTAESMLSSLSVGVDSGASTDSVGSEAQPCEGWHWLGGCTPNGLVGDKLRASIGNEELTSSSGAPSFAGNISSLVGEWASSRAPCSAIGIGELVAGRTAASNAAASLGVGRGIGELVARRTAASNAVASLGVGRAAESSLKRSAYTTCASSASLDSPPTGAFMLTSFGTIEMAIPRN